ncbi:MAG: hypothetical protein K0S71_962 [Clostridia bacterium]|jgi:YesN/AraC family two-component response regulator|nr:hypothetical protein [Clostridia bacterium]
MIRVMIVEDEPPIMRVIAKFVESFGENFKVVATAINGKKALEILETESVDVVFTDIKMPVMDGLKLTEHIKEQRPETIVIIISGFQDFEYARTALKFQVYDYLLKPIAQDNINSVLSKVQNELLVKDKEKQRQNIISLINENHVSEARIAVEKRYAVFLVCAGTFPLIPNDSMLPARSVWEEVNFADTISHLLLPEENSMCFNGKSAAEMVVVFETKSEKRITEAADQLLNQLSSKSYLPVTIVSGGQTVKLSDIGQVLKELRDKLYVSIKLFKSQVIWQHHAQASAYLDTKVIAETIFSALNLDSDKLQNCLLTALARFVDAGFTQLQTVAFFSNIINTVYLKNEPIHKDTSSLKMDLDTAISNAVDDKALAKDIAFIMLEANYQDFNQNEKASIPDIAQTIEEYLQNNYRESITTNMLSKKFGFVPSYISKLFRAYKGMSPSEYLTYYRIEKSKQIMSTQPELMCKEVAAMVGFNDQYHFSKTFKKQSGMWPTEYAVKKQ